MKPEADILLRSGRRWLISSGSIAAEPSVLAAYVLVCPFVVDLDVAEAIVGTARSTGCHLIVCVGPVALRGRCVARPGMALLGCCHGG